MTKFNQNFSYKQIATKYYWGAFGVKLLQVKDCQPYTMKEQQQLRQGPFRLKVISKCTKKNTTTTTTAAAE